MTPLPDRITQFLAANTYADIHQAMSQAVGLLRECAAMHEGIHCIIRQVRQSAVMGEDAQAVADELEALIGGDDDAI